MNILNATLDSHQDRRLEARRQASRASEATSLAGVLPPEERLARFDAWARAELATRLDWAWAGSGRDRRIEQCRVYLERIVLDLWRRGWMLDGARLARHITSCLDAVAAQQKAGKVANFWAYYQASVDRYVGANAEEIREEALRAGTHIQQLVGTLCRPAPKAPSLPELLALRRNETEQSKQSLRTKAAAARQRKKDQTKGQLGLGFARYSSSESPPRDNR